MRKAQERVGGLKKFMDWSEEIMNAGSSVIDGLGSPFRFRLGGTFTPQAGKAVDTLLRFYQWLLTVSLGVDVYAMLEGQREWERFREVCVDGRWSEGFVVERGVHPGTITRQELVAEIRTDVKSRKKAVAEALDAYVQKLARGR